MTEEPLSPSYDGFEPGYQYPYSSSSSQARVHGHRGSDISAVSNVSSPSNMQMMSGGTPLGSKSITDHYHQMYSQHITQQQRQQQQQQQQKVITAPINTHTVAATSTSTSGVNGSSGYNSLPRQIHHVHYPQQQIQQPHYGTIQSQQHHIYVDCDANLHDEIVDCQSNQPIK